MADIVDIYMECGDFHAAVKQSGLQECAKSPLL